MGIFFSKIVDIYGIVEEKDMKRMKRPTGDY